MNLGVLVSFEGIEGSGKTTQAELLYHDLKTKGVPVVLFRDPGSTEVGERIRAILLDPKVKISPWCELFLYLAARSELVRSAIIPSLKEKKVVILDRFCDSTFAYQAFGRGLPSRRVSVINKIATRAIKPNLTILVDIEPAKGLKRITHPHDRIEAEDRAYHQKVREGYLRLARRARKRIKVLDGDKPKEELHLEVKGFVYPLLREKGYRL